MLNLLLNENMKVYRRPRTWILMAVLIVLAATMLIFVHNSNRTPQITGDWQTAIQKQMANDQQRLQRVDIDPDRKNELETAVKIDQYRLDHNEPPADHSLWGGVLNTVRLISLVTIFTVIIAADSVAGEFSSGTIKLLLINPVSRFKILLSKYITTLIFSLLLLVLLFCAAFLVSGLLEGFKDVGLPYIYASSDHVIHSVNMAGHVIGSYGYASIEMIIIVTMAFMISAVFRSSLIAMGLSLGIMFVGSGVAAFLAQYQYSWAKYFLFENTDLTVYLTGNPNIAGMTLSFSIMVLIVYFLIFNALSIYVFNKRDVAA